MTEIKITSETQEQEIPVDVAKTVGTPAVEASGEVTKEWKDPDRWTSDHDLAREYGTETDGGM